MTERVKILTWERISLVVPEKQDIELWYRWVNDIETALYIWSNFWKVIYRENEEEFYDNLIKEKDNNTFCIYIEKESKVVWYIALTDINYRDRNASILIAIFDKENQNKWYWTEAMKLILKYAFEVLWLNKVQLWYLWTNVRAKKVYENIWFKEVWRLRDDVYAMWKFHDKVIMEIFKEEFKL